MRALDGLRDEYMFVLSQGSFTFAQNKIFVMRWNDAVRELEKHYDIKGKPEARMWNNKGCITRFEPKEE